MEVEKAEPRTLYVRRDVLNGDEIVSWAKRQGFETTLPASDLHVTIVYSKRPVDWMQMGQAYPGQDGKLAIPPGGVRMLDRFGEATVLLFASSELCWRHEEMLRNGASSDHPEYQPHITISWKADDVDLDKVEPYRGKIILGPEIFEPINEDWRSTVTEKFESADGAQVVKVDAGLGLVFGWAIVSKLDGEDYFDTQGDHIPEDAMLAAATDFMANSRLAKEMHVGDGKGSVVFAWPMTTDIARAMGITSKSTGLMIAMKPDSPDVLQKFADGTYTGFSIGGRRITDEEVA